MTRCLTCRATIPRGSRCPACAKAYRNRSPRERARIIARDGGCVMPPPHDGPLEVDHIRPLTEGGSDTDPRNKRTLCEWHHRQKTYGGKR